MLHLLDPSGTRVADEDDMAEGNTDAYLEYTAQAPGRYQVLANSYGETETGRYTLRIEVLRPRRRGPR